MSNKLGDASVWQLDSGSTNCVSCTGGSRPVLAMAGTDALELYYVHLGPGNQVDPGIFHLYDNIINVKAQSLNVIFIADVACLITEDFLPEASFVWLTRLFAMTVHKESLFQGC